MNSKVDISELFRFFDISIVKNERNDDMFKIRSKDVKLTNNSLKILNDLPIISLILNDVPITDLSDLKLPNLKRLRLNNVYVSDLTPISSMINLESLDIVNMENLDLSPLKKLHNLKKLNLTNTPISDISSLSKLTNLKTLDLWDTKVIDISPIFGLNDLKQIYLNNPKIPEQDIKFLTKMLPRLSIIQPLSIRSKM